ncbi:MAG: trypsin-like peptidase domain-containing protein [Chthonomonadales bacterium]
MRKSTAYVFMFVAGAAMATVTLNYMQRQNNRSAAQRNVLAILDRPMPMSPIPESPVVTAAAKIEPSVVNIDTMGKKMEGTNVPGRASGYLFEGKGSGVIISPEGYIITNNHVIEGASIIRVVTTKDRKFEARVVGTDPAMDLAIVKIDATNLPVAEFGNSDLLKVGEDAIAIGNPLGVGVTVTHGIISATDRKNLPVGDDRVIAEAVQTDAPIQKGNSGGALANIKGQLIGINTAIRSETGGNVGIGFAIPINSVRKVIRRLIEQGQGSRVEVGMPYIGVTGFSIPAKRALELHLPTGTGFVMEVLPLMPADNAGIQNGSIALEIDGKKVADLLDLKNAVLKHKPGEKVIVKLITPEGNPMDVPVIVGRRPAGF